MRPPYCPDDAPPGEAALFDALASGSGTDSWIVLHSLAIAAHVRQVEGEADFVVIVPERGVLVIEVKSHRNVEMLLDGRWKLGKESPTTRGPFKQSAEAMHSIRDYLTSPGVDMGATPMLNAVWFTHVRARTKLPTSPEWHAWQLLDSEDMRTGPVAAIERVIAAGTEHLRRKIVGFPRGAIGPSSESALRIANLLRPRFEAATVAGDVRRARASQLAAFVDEQYEALDNMHDNRAVLFTGPAGSGKTWLAVEAGRREVAQGRSGRLLCFNRLLAQHLQQQLASLTGLRVATFHQEARRISGLTVSPDAGPEFWDDELPDRAIEALLENPYEAGDFLIVDEIQDLARQPCIDVLDLLVTGGFQSGRVLLFGDFERQAIYERGDGREHLRARIPGLAAYGLTINCRNLPRIGTVVKRLSHMSPGYRRFRRPDDGADPEFIPMPHGADQSAALREAVGQLKDEGYSLDEIVVLSPLRSGSTAETTTDAWLRQILQPADGRPPRPGQLRYSTIHGFKGLDAPAVVVTDLDATTTPNFEALLYIGLTRATDRLFALIDTQTLRAVYGGNA